MRFSLAIVAASVSAVSAQSIADFPTCAQVCLGPPNLGDCPPPPAGDLTATTACVCALPKVYSRVTDCATNFCALGDVAKTLSALMNLCMAPSISGTDSGASRTSGTTIVSPEPSHTSASGSKTVGGAAETGGSTSIPPGPSPTPTKRSVPWGAVGGAVGGTVVLAGLLFVLLWVRRQRRRSNAGLDFTSSKPIYDHRTRSATRAS